MKLYHYSNNKFYNFELKKEFQKTSDEGLQEGCGIYLSDDKEAFKTYGNICYTVDINEVYDFTTIKSIYKIVDIFLKKYDTNRILLKLFKNNFFVKDYIAGIKTGHYSISNLIKNIWLCLEEDIYKSDANFDLFDYEGFLVENWKSFLKLKVIKYYDRNFKKNVYIAKNAELVKILIISE